MLLLCGVHCMTFNLGWGKGCSCGWWGGMMYMFLIEGQDCDVRTAILSL
jgi:hypothetical protein